MKQKPFQKPYFLWLDLEMTGLDVEKEVIIEVATVVTDKNLNFMDQYHAIVKQPDTYLQNMDEWNKKQHKLSGLLDEIPHGLDPDTVESDLIKFSKKYFPKEKIVLAGNSIHHDRSFIQRYFKKWFEYIHYRLLDVSSFKIVMSSFYNIQYKQKKGVHRAQDDILESIAEMKFYLESLTAKKQ